jgi:DNA-binding NarL/FixJ family response regulator
MKRDPSPDSPTIDLYIVDPNAGVYRKILGSMLNNRFMLHTCNEQDAALDAIACSADAVVLYTVRSHVVSGAAALWEKHSPMEFANKVKIQNHGAKVILSVGKDYDVSDLMYSSVDGYILKSDLLKKDGRTPKLVKIIDSVLKGTFWSEHPPE